MSKFTLYDWRCQSCDTKFEHYDKPDVKETSCPKCGNTARRLISAPTIALNGLDPDFPRAYDAWEKQHRAKTQSDKKFYKDHGADKKHHSYGS